MKYEPMILGIFAVAVAMVQAAPVPTPLTETPKENCKSIIRTLDGKKYIPEECLEIWNYTVHTCGLEPAPQHGTSIPADQYRACLEGAIRGFKAFDQDVSQPAKRESDQDRQRREREFRERREKADRERREREDRERREREDRERREREDRERREREQNNRDKDGKPTNVCTHDDWKNKRPCAQPR